jgi:tyrosyl-tRNA synthetase
MISVRDFLQTLRGITHSNLIQRDMFQDRIEGHQELYLHELMYPVLQGLDSLMIHRIFGSCDLEIGGTDQLFNNLMGRTVMKNAGVPPQSVAAFSLLEGLDGSEKMSKSQDNYIGVNDDPEDMYGKVMSLPDELIGRWFELTTFSPEIEVNDIKKALTSENANPYDLKKRLAREIVVIYHGEDAADKAAQSFSNTFSKGEIPADIPEIKLNDSETLGEALVRQKIVPSKTQWRRLIDQNSVTELNSNKKVTDEKLVPQSGEVFRIGKKRFVRVTDN